MSIWCSSGSRKNTSHCIISKWCNRKNVKDNKCDICMFKINDCVIIPCGHANCCLDCIKIHMTQNNTCPICRQHIKGVYRIYK